MNPKIEATTFGGITIAGRRFKHDVIIRLDGSIEKRKKKLSKREYGTSHLLSRKEAKHVYEKGAGLLVIGTGQFNSLRLSEEAQNYFRKKKCKTMLAPTPEAIHTWNDAAGKTIGLFHVTC
ncbi:MAG: hypothetical protein GTO14_08420 [Anaerolineales bacterium]|nr:hypothetical protein [Anaerolineales bacterium]